MKFFFQILRTYVWACLQIAIAAIVSSVSGAGAALLMPHWALSVLSILLGMACFGGLLWLIITNTMRELIWLEI